MKKVQSLLKKIAICSTATTLLLVSNAQAFSPQNQVETVGNLLLKSSAAKKVIASDNKEVAALYQLTKDYYEQAKLSTDPEETKRLLGLVVKNMVKAGKMADHGAALGDKYKRDFDNRLTSIQALLSAQESIGEEKTNSTATQVHDKVDDLIALAQVQYGKQEYIAGRDTLDQAYVILKTSIENMRGGDTLTNSLDFATPQEEYAYYQTKTQSQLTALNLFKAKATAGKKKMLNNIITKSTQFIDKANVHFNEGEYEASITLMEKALKRLQSGLMMALN